MRAPRVAVVGGGLAGLKAAVVCAESGARVQLLEARPRLGGATWSFARDGLEVDNGQHVFMRCCTHYMAWLGRLGVRDRVHLQERLAVPVLRPGREPLWIRRGWFPAPAHLAGSLLRFDALPLSARLRAAATARAFSTLDPEDPALDDVSLGDWLRSRGESDAAIDGFWDLLVRPTLNMPARSASLALAARVMRTGFLERNDGSEIGWSEVPLARLHAEPAAALLRSLGARVALRTRVERIEPARKEDGTEPVRLHTSGGVCVADVAIVCVPPRDAGKMLGDVGRSDASCFAELGCSPIVNLHTVWSERVLPYELAAGLGTPVEWMFDRTASSGLPRGQYVTVSLSAANDWVGRSREELQGVFEPALRALLPKARPARLERLFVTCEREATFEQRSGQRRLRPRPGRIAPGIYLAGAWTDTGWPATMEGAVRSGLAAACDALRDTRPDRIVDQADAE